MEPEAEVVMAAAAEPVEVVEALMAWALAETVVLARSAEQPEVEPQRVTVEPQAA